MNPSNPDLIAQFKTETGRNAIWNGKFTKVYLKWHAGDKIYDSPPNENRITAVLSKEERRLFDVFRNETELSTSNIIRNSTKLYISIFEQLKEQDIDFQLDHLEETVISIIRNDIIGKNKRMLDLFNDSISKLSSARGFIELAKKNGLDEECISHLDNSIAYIIKVANNFKEHFFKPIHEKYDILLIEDESSMIEMLKSAFAIEGYSLIAMSHADLVLNALKEFIPKVILLDLGLPNYKGDDLAVMINKNKKYKSIPIYILTAKAFFNKKEKQELLEKTNALDIFEKHQFEVDSFIKTVLKHL